MDVIEVLHKKNMRCDERGTKNTIIQ